MRIPLRLGNFFSHDENFPQIFWQRLPFPSNGLFQMSLGKGINDKRWLPHMTMICDLLLLKPSIRKVSMVPIGGLSADELHRLSRIPQCLTSC